VTILSRDGRGGGAWANSAFAFSTSWLMPSRKAPIIGGSRLVAEKASAFEYDTSVAAMRFMARARARRTSALRSSARSVLKYSDAVELPRPARRASS